MTSPTPANATHIILFYKYVEIKDIEKVVKEHEDLCGRLNLYGRVLLSPEGVNATLSGTEKNIKAYVEYMINDSVFKMELDDFKRSIFEGKENEVPFPELSIKVVSEIVSTGGVVPRPVDTEKKGYLTPTEFHKAIGERDDQTIILDVRNHKEFAVGHFADAVDPQVRTYSEYYSFLDKRKEELKSKSKVLMYCTGGIRCEKASNYLRSQGIDEVYQLRGGIHKYLEAYPDGGHYKGKNFVFDQRVTMKSNDETIVGKCLECDVAFDQFHGRNVCTVCRDLVLVCPSCVTKLNGELHCKQHQYLKTCYFTFLQYFSTEELSTQRAKLQEILDYALKKEGWKKKRQTLRKQIDKIQEEISRRADQETVPERTGIHCRTCRATTCDGTCWGFWTKLNHALPSSTPVDPPKA